MTQSNDREDSQWLAALAGQPDSTADARLNREAEAVRKALQSGMKSLDTEVPAADQALYEQTVFRLRREGLLRKRAIWNSSGWLAVAASAVLGIGLAVQMTRVNEETLRSGSPATVQIVSSPESRLRELLAGLEGAKTEPQVERLETGAIRLTLTATPEALDYLSSQRLEPMIQDGRVVIEIRPQPKGE